MNEKQIERERKKLLEKVRDHMIANNITQEEAAKKCGWEQPTVARMLNGDFGPKLDNLLMLCTAVGLRLELRDVLYKQGEE